MQTDSLTGFSRLVASLASNTFNRALPDYSKWDTVIPLTKRDTDTDTSLENPYVITTEAGELITVFDLQGVFQIVGAEHFSDMLTELAQKMVPYCQKNGHLFWFSYEEDPDRAYEELARIVAPQITASRRMGLNVEDVILDRISKNSSRCHFEQNLVVLKTTLAALTKDTVKSELKTKLERNKGKPLPKTGQNLETIYETLATAHCTLVERFIDDFQKCDSKNTSGFLMRRLEIPAATRLIRIMLDRERTSQNWKPRLISDGGDPHGQLTEIDDFLPTKLKWQICTYNPQIVEGTSYVSTGQLYHATLCMETGPQDIRQFSELLDGLDRSIPKRFTYKLVPKGLDTCKLRDVVTSIFGFFGQPKRVKTALDYLKSVNERDPVMAMQFNASTWANDLETLKRRVATLDAALQSWGVPQIVSAIGDPIAFWTASVPGFSHANPSPVMTPPLREALEMLPFARPASPFANGWMIASSQDGKIIPLHPYSPLQDTWIRLLSGTPGSGKSLFMNVLNFAFAVAPGYVRLPLALIMDVGKSSFGLVSLLRDELPEDRKHEVQSIELENTREFCTNILDTQLGLRFPLPHERQFILTVLKLICSFSDDKKIPEGLEAFLGQVVDKAFHACAEGEGRFLYQPNIDSVIDTALASLHDKRPAGWWEDARWWEIVDLLFENDLPVEASIAQRYAVPEIKTLIAIAASEELKNMYPNLMVSKTGETIQEFVIRNLRDIATTYPIFAGRTRFEVSPETRILSVDLARVLEEGEERKGIFYLLARHLGTRSFFLQEDKFMPHCPPLYREHHRVRIQANRSEMRLIAADESHNFKDDSYTAKQFETDARQGRKNGLVVMLVSQYMEDHHPLLRAAATDVFVMRGGSDSDTQILRDEFNISEATLQRLQRECRGPGPHGANFLGFFKTSIGSVCHILNNTACATELWAFNTNQTDMVIRDELYKRFGTRVARQYLARRFPSGTTKAFQNHVRNKGVNEEGQSVTGYVVELISNEIMETQNEIA